MPVFGTGSYAEIMAYESRYSSPSLRGQSSLLGNKATLLKQFPSTGIAPSPVEITTVSVVAFALAI